jgi:hypothetical protein
MWSLQRRDQPRPTQASLWQLAGEPVAPVAPVARNPRPIHCIVCGTRVCSDDAIGLIPEGMTHAECALVHMLDRENPDRVRRRPGLVAASSGVLSEQQWDDLLLGLLDEEA